MYNLWVQFVGKSEPTDMGMRYEKTPKHGDVIKIDAERRRVRARIVTIRTRPAEIRGVPVTEEIIAVEDFIQPRRRAQLLVEVVAQWGRLRNFVAVHAPLLGTQFLAGLVSQFDRWRNLRFPPRRRSSGN
jgi:hypothetical protein